MRTMIVGGRSSLALAMKPVLAGFSEVVTAGREGCDIKLDVNAPAEEIVFPAGIDAVINTSAGFAGTTIADMIRTESVNVLGAMKICNACVLADVKHVVQISSVHADLDAASPFYGMYALSKRHAEDVARLCCAKAGLPLAILRPSQFYGLGEGFRKHQPFFFSIADKAASNQEITFYGSHDAARNFIHVEDVAKIIALVVQRKIEGTYACTNPANVTYSEIAAAAIRAFRSSSAIRFLPAMPDIADNVSDFDGALYQAIGFSPEIDIRAGMAKEAASRKLRT